jgi:guanylate cyclase
VGRAQASGARLLERLAEIGAGPQDPQDARLRAGALIFAAVVIVVLSFVWVVTYSIGGLWVSAAIPATYQVITVLGLFVLARTKRFDRFRTLQLALFLALPALLQASLGGFAASSAMVMWSIVTPLGAVALLGWRRAVPWLVAFAVVALVLGAVDGRLARDPAGLPSGVVVTFYVLNLFGVTLSAFALIGYFVHQRDLAQAALELERERSERLLRNVLPAPIAERLKRGEGTIAERHEDVTVLFADLVGFTALSKGMGADEAVDLLDELFAAFDGIADAEGLVKIKTIGDAYMAVGGAPEPMPGHVEAVVRAAIAIRGAVGEIAERRGIGDALAVRIGIDTGPAVAGVIGRRRFIYDLWGDTVNTASRMESHGVPGEIQVTERVARGLGERFPVRSRGRVEVKGLGSMETFLIGAGGFRPERRGDEADEDPHPRR